MPGWSFQLIPEPGPELQTDSADAVNIASVDRGQYIVDADGCTYSYGSSVAVQDVSFEIHASDLTVILGPNGSGKSTLLKLMLGLLKPTSGSMRLFGVDAHKFKEWNKVAYVPQVVEEMGRGFPATVEELVAQGPLDLRDLP